MLTSTSWDGPHPIDEDVGHVTGGGASELLWVDLENPTDAELDEAQRAFELHPLALEDLRTPDERPKVEAYGDDVTLIVAFTPDLGELGIVVGPSWVLTVRMPGPEGTCWNLDAVVGRMRRHCPPNATPGFLLWAILDSLVDAYLDRADETEDAIEALEDAIFAEQLGDERAVQQRIFTMRRGLLAFRRKAVPLRDVLAALVRGDVAGIGDELRAPLQDVYDHHLRVIDALDTQRELLAGAVDAHYGMISNRMNHVMKTMTSWGAILLGSTLIAGIYGMNFQHMPELGWKYGYLWALGLMVAVTTFLVAYFRKRHWL